jgi:hypothetical protein
MRRQQSCGGNSEWNESDFRQAHESLSKVAFGSYGSDGLSAEIGLKRGAVSVFAGDTATCLLQLIADQPHPELGGGLLVLLQMPHNIADNSELAQLCGKLNCLEMAPADLPPHFGAWCPGSDCTLTYVSFLPNALHNVIPGIAMNCAFWAFHRAHWADAILATFGVRPPSCGEALTEKHSTITLINPPGPFAPIKELQAFIDSCKADPALKSDPAMQLELRLAEEDLAAAKKRGQE